MMTTVEQCSLAAAILVLAGALGGCAPAPVKAATLSPNRASPASKQIAAIPPDAEDPDLLIAGAVDAALFQANLHDKVKYSVKHQVVTLTGKVSSQLVRTRATEVAARVANVDLVVNEIRVKKPVSRRPKR